jgi:hypothetical protein
MTGDMNPMTVIAVGVFLLVVGMNGWSHFPPNLVQLAHAAATRKAIFFTTTGTALSLGGLFRAFVPVRGDHS